MITFQKILPPTKRWRELWLPEQGLTARVPSIVQGGHSITNAGARVATTANGVHFTGGATSNIVVAANAVQNAKAAFHITIRFKLDTTFAAGAPANQYLFQKLLAADDYIRVYLAAADGKLYWQQGNLAGGVQFTLTSTTVSWTAGTWYTVTVSLTDIPAQRLIVNGTAEDTDVQAAVATPNGGDMVIGSSSDGGADGNIGTISWVVIGVGATAVVALTATEETDLVKGFPPATAKVQYMFTMDEGRGVTVTDRGSAGGNGTLDSACTWAFDSRRLKCMTFNGLSLYGSSVAGVKINGNVSMVWVGKMKSTYNALGGTDRYLYELWIDNNTVLQFYYNVVGNQFEFQGVVGGATTSAFYTWNPAIDDYAIIICVNDSGRLRLYLNGLLVATSAAVLGGYPGTNAIAYLGAEDSPANYDVSKPIIAGLVEGALSALEVRQLSRTLNDILDLKLNI